MFKAALHLRNVHALLEGNNVAQNITFFCNVVACMRQMQQSTNRTKAASTEVKPLFR